MHESCKCRYISLAKISTKTRGHYQAEAGKLLQLMRGIYVDADANADELVRRHAIRIAHYLYPKAYLSAASAALLGPTADGRLYLIGRRNQRTRLRSLEIVQNEAPPHPSVGDAVVDDGLGEFRVSGFLHTPALPRGLPFAQRACGIH